MIEIKSNGSKWAGEKPDDIETLLRVLGKHMLDPSFEVFAGERREGFIHDRGNGVKNFFGNFFTVSHVFNIDTDEPELIEQLTSAINANRERDDYKAELAFRTEKRGATP